jgi:taurine dioxygenase
MSMTVVHEPVTITVRPIAGHIGADISGVDIARPLHRYKVIFFRDQRLEHASQIAFGRQFGTLVYAHPHDEAPSERLRFSVKLTRPPL